MTLLTLSNSHKHSETGRSEVTMRQLVIHFFLLAVLVLMGSIDCSAAGFRVNSTADINDRVPGDGVCQTFNIGQCTLRAAVTEANALAGADTISVPAGTFTLSNGPLFID